MDAKTSKVFIKLGEIEITIEGNADFVTRQFRTIFGVKKPQKDEALHSNAIKQATTSKAKSSKSAKAKNASKPAASGERQKTPQEMFEEWLKKLSKTVTNQDKVLIVGYYILLNKKSDFFSIREIKNFLKEKGIDIPNVTMLIKDISSAEKILRQVLKNGRKFYQFTHEGKQYMKDLLSVKDS